MNATLLTAPQSLGPMFSTVMEYEGSQNSVPDDDPDAVVIFGRITDRDNNPCVGMIEFWSEGQFARSLALDGNFRVVIKKPAAVPGKAGAAQAPYMNIDLFVNDVYSAHFRSRIYFPDLGEQNQADPVLALVDPDRRHTLIGIPTEDGLKYDIRLTGGDSEQVFLALSEQTG